MKADTELLACTWCQHSPSASHDCTAPQAQRRRVWGLPLTRCCMCAAAGDQYEGVWKDGLENGTGTSTAADGASFYGFWVDGRMHGEGVSC